MFIQYSFPEIRRFQGTFLYILQYKKQAAFKKIRFESNLGTGTDIFTYAKRRKLKYFSGTDLKEIKIFMREEMIGCHILSENCHGASWNI